MTNKYNDHRAAHRVDVLGIGGIWGTCVMIPYRGYTISLARNGENTIAYDSNTMKTLVDCGEVYGTSGESIRKVMDIIDATVGPSDTNEGK